MEKRISPVELRLGFNIFWKNNFFTAQKFYTDSTKLNLFILYFFNGLQKELGYTVPTPLIKIFVSKEYFLINYIYINNKRKKKATHLERLKTLTINGEYYSNEAEKKIKKFMEKDKLKRGLEIIYKKKVKKKKE